MISEQEVVDRIIELMMHYELPDRSWEGDVEDYAELATLQTVLDRELTQEEFQRVEAGWKELME